ncbi:GntR family transcriptional regulator [Paracoccus pacificus]|uniref:GntR family transcriptional regulator n=1 Tax=Paracoccus pacificus TaxID=1463598 RepID=A0ABW4RC75_9RHOB
MTGVRTQPKARAIADSVHRRIVDRIWRPGDQIPHEAELAVEFGASRATVNKAMQLLADQGLIERRRKAGTRVAINPAVRATLSIPVVREQVEANGQDYHHVVLERIEAIPPREVLDRMGAGDARMVRLQTLHLADDLPFAFEDRWVNPGGAAGLAEADFTGISVNEWLVRYFPYSRGLLEVGSESASPRDARILRVDAGTSLLVLHRTTWNGDVPITDVRVAHAPGYRMRTAF